MIDNLKKDGLVSLGLEPTMLELTGNIYRLQESLEKLTKLLEQNLVLLQKEAEKK